MAKKPVPASTQAAHTPMTEPQDKPQQHDPNHPLTKGEPAAVWVDIDELKPWDKNPRHNDGAVPAVVASIKRLGFGAPIIARTNGEVIAGHTRLKAAQQLGLERVPVRYMDLDPADARLLAIADNKAGEIATWDNDVLGELLSEMDPFDLDALEDMGFDADEMLELMGVTEGEDGAGAGGEGQGEPAPVYTPGGSARLVLGDCVEVMRGLPAESFDSCVCDPPYGIGFMGKEWDALPPGPEFARELLRVLKPGAHAVLFGGQRTLHRLTTVLDDAGFEVRDLIGWQFWSGFPKSHDVSKAIDKAAGAEREVVGTSKGTSKVGGDKDGTPWSVGAKQASVDVPITAPATDDAKRWDGWGTALKPCIEPAILVRKPLDGTVAENVLKHGTGGLNIDACRYPFGDVAWAGPSRSAEEIRRICRPNTAGQPTGGVVTNTPRLSAVNVSDIGRWPANVYACPKPSTAERERGCGGLGTNPGGVLEGRRDGSLGAVTSARHNDHPTLKPVRLMRWLSRLVTPPGGKLLDPFAGSGSEGVAAVLEGFDYTGIEIDAHYHQIAEARVGHAQAQPEEWASTTPARPDLHESEDDHA